MILIVLKKERRETKHQINIKIMPNLPMSSLVDPYNTVGKLGRLSATISKMPILVLNKSYAFLVIKHPKTVMKC